MWLCRVSDETVLLSVKKGCEAFSVGFMAGSCIFRTSFGESYSPVLIYRGLLGRMLTQLVQIPMSGFRYLVKGNLTVEISV